MSKKFKIQEVEYIPKPVRKKKKKLYTGKDLQEVIVNSICNASVEGRILQWDRPERFFLESKNLFCDYWFFSTSGVFVVIECKQTIKNKVKRGMIKEHQLENVIKTDKGKNSRGYFALWFKDGTNEKGLFFISGEAIDLYFNNFSRFSDRFELNSPVSYRGSIFLEDLIAASYFNTDDVLMVPVLSRESFVNKKTERYIDLTVLKGVFLNGQ